MPPSGLNATQVAAPSGPVRAAVQVWLATSHSRTRRPLLTSDPSGLTPWSQPLASTRPVGLNATECTLAPWPSRTAARNGDSCRAVGTTVATCAGGAVTSDLAANVAGPGRSRAVSCRVSVAASGRWLGALLSSALIIGAIGPACCGVDG